MSNLIFIRSVFPTHVGLCTLLQELEGVISLQLESSITLGGLPHACGGVSELAKLLGYKDESSPHMWGCFCRSF